MKAALCWSAVLVLFAEAGPGHAATEPRQAPDYRRSSGVQVTVQY